MPSPAPSRPSLKLVKSFPYEGGTKQWSNRYFFTGSNPLGTAGWQEVVDALSPNENGIYLPNVQQIQAVGYNAGSDVPVFDVPLAVAGRRVNGVQHVDAPGDCAAIIRWSTDQRSVKNHPIYLFKYYHGCDIDLGSDGDTLSPSMHTGLTNYVTNIKDGWVVDGTLRQHCGPRGAVALVGTVEPYIRHRDFPD